MTRQSELLEQEAEEARIELAASLEALRQRMTPGQIVDEVVDYARDTPVAEFGRNLLRDIRESPLPLVLIVAGVAWAIALSAMAQRRLPARARTARPTAAVEARPTEARPATAPQWEMAPLNETVA